jgi:hypothetical protein
MLSFVVPFQVYDQMDGDVGDANGDDQQEDRQTRATGTPTHRTCLRKHEIRHDRIPVVASWSAILQLACVMRREGFVAFVFQMPFDRI